MYIFIHKFKPQIFKFIFSEVDTACMEKINRKILNFFKSIKNFYTLNVNPFCDTIIIGID
jgi:hypothetical protein